jgi:hypothetical protein
LKPSLIAAALSLLFADIVAVILLQLGGLALAGGFKGLGQGARGRTTAAGFAALIGATWMLGIVSADPAAAQFDWRPRPFQLPSPYSRPFARDQLGQREQVQTIPPSRPPSATEMQALRATERVTFGYILTGDAQVDATSRDGLAGLVKMLAYRTAVEAAQPMGVNIDKDDIAFYPILYWPVLPKVQALPEPTLAKIDAYMKEGGLIIFDTRDYGQGMPSGFSVNRTGESGTPLQRLLGKLDIPRLEPVPEGHVLTKSFYLLRSFPGRWDGGQLWVEADGGDAADQGRRARRSDGVTTILVTPNDLAAAWALDERGQPLYPVVPGGERQREMAYRTGINIVMHALTGNYKADQVHVPALLDRLGQ